MNRQDILLQISIVSNLLEGVRNNDFMRLLGKMIPKVFDVPREASDLRADVQRLRQTWGELYWGDEATSENGASRPRAGSDHAVVNRRGPWAIEEERRFLADLDDLGWLLFTAFGRVRKRMNGRWSVQMSAELVYDAESLRKPASSDMFERAYAIAMEGMLMRSANGLPRRELLACAEDLAPACYELFVTEDPAFVIQSIAERLLIEGLLREGPAGREREVMFTLTPRGQARSLAAIDSWKSSRIDSSGVKASEQLDDELPF